MLLGGTQDFVFSSKYCDITGVKRPDGQKPNVMPSPSNWFRDMFCTFICGGIWCENFCGKLPRAITAHAR